MTLQTVQKDHQAVVAPCCPLLCDSVTCCCSLLLYTPGQHTFSPHTPNFPYILPDLRVWCRHRRCPAPHANFRFPFGLQDFDHVSGADIAAALPLIKSAGVPLYVHAELVSTVDTPQVCFETCFETYICRPFKHTGAPLCSVFLPEPLPSKKN